MDHRESESSSILIVYEFPYKASKLATVIVSSLASSKVHQKCMLQLVSECLCVCACVCV